MLSDDEQEVGALMGDVLDFRTPDTVKYGSGDVICLQCRHSWQERAPLGTTVFGCPECGTSKGVRRGVHMPGNGEYMRVCNCGNEFFIITAEYTICASCGQIQKF